MALAFAEKDFSEVPLIRLHVMPDPVVQQQYLVSFRQRVTTLMKESACTSHALTSKQADEMAWQQIETLLLGHGTHLTLLNKLDVEKEGAGQNDRKGEDNINNNLGRRSSCTPIYPYLPIHGLMEVYSLAR